MSLLGVGRFLPEHVVVEHILPKVQDSLPIDTRLAFRLRPRPVRVPVATRALLDRYVRTRTRPISSDGDGDYGDGDAILGQTKSRIVKGRGTLMSYGSYDKMIMKLVWCDSRYVIKKWFLFREPSEHLMAETETHYAQRQDGSYEYEYAYFEIV